MSSVEQLFPVRAVAPVGDLLPERGSSLSTDDAVEFLADVSRALRHHPVGRERPELVALAYFLRRSAVRRLAEELSARERPEVKRYPVGLVFHVAPSNVDTMFVYSWALALLCANTNVVRLSSRAGQAAEVLVEVLADVATRDQHARIAASQRILRYGHDDDVTARLSRWCDLRVLWGGDASIEAVRRHPLRASARDITFADRNSFALIDASRYQRLDDVDRWELAERLYNDVFWFDQAGCSSPRWLIWRSPPGGDLDAVRTDLVAQLRAVARDKRYVIEPGRVLDKLVGAYGAVLEGHADRIDANTNELMTLWCDAPDRLPRRYLGAGVLVESRVEDLLELVPVIQRADQTVVHFGFSAGELGEFADRCGGRGVDRLVPIGDALSFSSTWDGYDLLDQFTRVVNLRGSLA